jgi:hypothetical protein
VHNLNELCQQLAFLHHLKDASSSSHVFIEIVFLQFGVIKADPPHGAAVREDSSFHVSSFQTFHDRPLFRLKFNNSLKRNLANLFCLQFGVIMADPPWDIHMELPYRRTLVCVFLVSDIP